MKYEEPMMDVTVLRKRNVVCDSFNEGDDEGFEFGDEFGDEFG